MRILTLFLCLPLAGNCAEQLDKLLARPWAAIVKAAPTSEALDAGQAALAAKALWTAHRKAIVGDKNRATEHSRREIKIGKRVMRFHFEVVGDPDDGPLPLYIALHGGGGAPPRINDSQYGHMKRYYLRNVKRGIYCATRGVSDTWDLHFQPESYVGYDRLIENMIAFEHANPNRVYIMGFSAGGDGVYQIAARMADRWAAAAMSAGHPNGVNPRNLYRLPLLTQIGERDRAYDRLRQTIRYHQRIVRLRDFEGHGYPHQINVHAAKPHNFFDNHPQQAPQEVIADPVAWLERGDDRTTQRNTSSIAWLDRHARNPQPDRVIWDRTTSAPRSAAGLWGNTMHGKQHYWLDVSGLEPGSPEIIARVDRAKNLVVLETLGQTVRLLLNDSMLDLDEPVIVELDGTRRQIQVKRSLNTMVKTLQQRGDPSHMYVASITAKRGPGVLILTTDQ